jgi:hypothetical protein
MSFGKKNREVSLIRRINKVIVLESLSRSYYHAQDRNLGQLVPLSLMITVMGK